MAMGRPTAPFLSDPGRNVVFTDPVGWSDALKDILRFKELDVSNEKEKPYRTTNSFIQSGDIRVLSIDAPTPFTVAKYESDAATIYMPYRAFTVWRDVEQQLAISSGEGILYFAPGTDIAVDTVDSAGVVTFVNRSTLIEKVVSLSRGALTPGLINSRIGRSQKFSVEVKAAAYLVESLYNCYWTLDGIYQAGEESLKRVVLDDTFLRILVLLLFPELRMGDGDSNGFGGKYALMKELEEWIVAHLDQPIKLGDLEARCCYTARSIHNYFCTQYNLSPKQWIIRQRMRKAFKLLMDGGDLTIVDVARACGYTDQSRFGRHFEREYGILPKDCRKAKLIHL